MSDDDDKDCSLLQLSRQHRTSIVSQLVQIGSVCNQLDHVKFRSFISSLQCLQPKGAVLRRRAINAFHQRQYVALSYTWNPSEYEDREPGQYPVENWDDECLPFSKVRKCVLDRVLRYMRHTGVRFLWIDAHCIRQDACGFDDCARHSRCVEKRDAIQAMDLVYQLSEHPVALLGRPLKTRSELDLLTRILLGDLLVSDRQNKLRAAVPADVAMEALLLLSKITQDSWWCRAWTFQENYRGGTQMQLLIRHGPSLESRKRRYSVFGQIPGELCILSIRFSVQATGLCLALRSMPGLLPQDAKRIDGVLRAAGRYRLMLRDSSSMTPTVIADIEARGLSKPWDRLAIVANCCQYPVRLDGGSLSRQGQSPSLSVLAMCLLNGEILDNGNNKTTSVAELKTSAFLDIFMFRRFNAPEDETRQLTFNKGCRLKEVALTVSGIATKGHLWKLGPVIDTATFRRRRLPWIDEPKGRLTLYERKRLLQLVFYLCDLGYRWLADRLDGYLAADACAGNEYHSFTEMYLHRMAIELSDAIRDCQKLRLGSIYDRSKQTVLYRAIFVWSDQSGDRAYSPAAFAFTSAWQADSGSQTHHANDIDRHVSLEVGKGPLGIGGVPQLRVRRWLMGMCFFDGCPRTQVVFPWPRALHIVKK
ncbi:hypothetical protein LZ31DRAFT_254661 [Colletotrichum somersetense]|nr:hypothetical protein LZ31DRAFT_254661 [Colletotrichum somersetense]